MMTPLLLAAALTAAASPAAATEPKRDLLRRIGSFESWAQEGPAGWAATFEGHGVVRTVNAHAGDYGAGFQTYFGDGELSAEAFLDGGQYVLIAQVGGEEAGLVGIEVRDLATGHYLSGAGTWQAEPADAMSQTEASAVGVYASRTLAFIAEGPGRTIRIRIHSHGDGPTAWVDQVRLRAPVKR